MKVIEKFVGELIPYADNPRNITDDAVDKVATSIREFGFQQPIVVDRDNVIIVGHTRYLAARKLKLKTVPVVVAENLDEQQVREYRLADNKTGEISAWDFPLLEKELEDLPCMDRFGFEQFEDLDLPLDDDEPTQMCYKVEVKCDDASQAALVFALLTDNGYNAEIKTKAR